jgi:hypothetical protein
VARHRSQTFETSSIYSKKISAAISVFFKVRIKYSRNFKAATRALQIGCIKTGQHVPSWRSVAQGILLGDTDQGATLSLFRSISATGTVSKRTASASAALSRTENLWRLSKCGIRYIGVFQLTRGSAPMPWI